MDRNGEIREGTVGDETCAIEGCENDPTHRVVIIYSIPGTPEVDVLVCDDHKDIVRSEPLN